MQNLKRQGRNNCQKRKFFKIQDYFTPTYVSDFGNLDAMDNFLEKYTLANSSQKRQEDKNIQLLEQK